MTLTQKLIMRALIRQYYDWYVIKGPFFLYHLSCNMYRNFVVTHAIENLSSVSHLAIVHGVSGQDVLKNVYLYDFQGLTGLVLLFSNSMPDPHWTPTFNETSCKILLVSYNLRSITTAKWHRLIP